MVEREMNSTAMSAKGRVRVSKHSAEELARLRYVLSRGYVLSRYVDDRNSYLFVWSLKSAL